MKCITKDGKRYLLESDHGKVSYLMRAGMDMVRNVMSENGAIVMMEAGRINESELHPGYPICIDNNYFFPGKVEPLTEIKPKKSRR